MQYQKPYPDEPTFEPETDSAYNRAFTGDMRGRGLGFLYARDYWDRARRYHPYLHGTDMLDAVATVQQFDSSTTGD